MNTTNRRLGLISLAVVSAAALGGCHSNDDRISITPTQIEYGVAVADFNGDGLSDVIAARTLYQNAAPTSAGTLYAYLHGAVATGGFAAPVTYAAGDEPVFLGAADLDGDGLPDLVSASFADWSLSVFLNSHAQPGTLTTPVVLSAPGISQFAIGDLNGDGVPDIVAADYAVDIFLGSATTRGTFLTPLGLSNGGANWVAIGDLNHDGMPDVVVTDATGVKVFFHAAPATGTSFAAPVTVFTQTPNNFFRGANDVVIADFNGDGYNDLAITDPGPPDNTPPSVYILLQDAAHPGQFLAPVAYSLPSGRVAQSFAAADLDGDGRMDLIVGDEAGVNVLLASATTAGTFGAPAYYPTPYGTFQFGVADVNGDGHPDIVVTNTATAPLVSGVYQTQTGVLLQDAAHPGAFLALQNLP